MNSLFYFRGSLRSFCLVEVGLHADLGAVALQPGCLASLCVVRARREQEDKKPREEREREREESSTVWGIGLFFFFRGGEGLLWHFLS